MANTKLTFLGSEFSEGTELECFANAHSQIFIRITEYESSPVHITLDVSTAIKLAKTLRSEINYIKEEGSYE